jgi:hypothetical protein
VYVFLPVLCSAVASPAVATNSMSSRSWGLRSAQRRTRAYHGISQMIYPKQRHKCIDIFLSRQTDPALGLRLFVGAMVLHIQEAYASILLHPAFRRNPLRDSRKVRTRRVINCQDDERRREFTSATSKLVTSLQIITTTSTFPPLTLVNVCLERSLSRGTTKPK